MIKLEDEELERIVAIFTSIKKTHASIGAVEEQKSLLQDRIRELRRAERNWEQEVESKYHLPSGLDWKIDLPNKAVVLPGEENSEMTDQDENADN